MTDSPSPLTLPSANEIAKHLERPPIGTAMCPLCGHDYPHQHSPREITIYRNGMKWGMRNGTQPWPWPLNQSDAEVGEHDTGRGRAARWAGANQHHEHRTGQPDTDGAVDQRNSGRAGLQSACDVQAQVTAPLCDERSSEGSAPVDPVAYIWSPLMSRKQFLAFEVPDIECDFQPLYPAAGITRWESISDAQISAIAEGMPGGFEGFLKGWGWQQFARAIEDECQRLNAPQS